MLLGAKYCIRLGRIVTKKDSEIVLNHEQNCSPSESSLWNFCMKAYWNSKWFHTWSSASAFTRYALKYSSTPEITTNFNTTFWDDPLCITANGSILAYRNLCFRMFKGATKSYFTHFTCMAIVLFNTASCRSVFFYEFF